MNENDFVKNIIVFLREYDFKVKTEIPNMGQSIDIVAYKGKWLTAIEVKMHDWRRAINQCETHELIVDFIYIAIATKSISEKLKDFASERGYGILHYNNNNHKKNIDLVLKARINKNFYKPQRDIFTKKMRAICYEY